MSHIPRPSSSNEKVAESKVDQMMALVRRTPLKPRPAKPPRKSKLPKMEKERISNEPHSNEKSEVKDFNGASNSRRQEFIDDCNSFAEKLGYQVNSSELDGQVNIKSTEELGAQVNSSELDGQVNIKSIKELGAQVNSSELDGQVDIKSTEELGAQVDTKSIEKNDTQVNNFESTVELVESSDCEVIEELSDAPSNQGIDSHPENILQFEMSKSLVIMILCLLKEELTENKGSAIHRDLLVAARDIFQKSLASPMSILNLKSPLPAYDLSNPGELYKVHEECLYLLQEMAYTSHRMTEMANKCKEGITHRLSEEEDSGSEEEYGKEDDYDEYSFPTFLANFFLVAAIVLAMLLPPIFYKFAESETGLFNYLRDIFNNTSFAVHGQD